MPYTLSLKLFYKAYSSISAYQIRDVQDCYNPVIPAKAGILTNDWNPVSRDHRLCGGTKKVNLHFSWHIKVEACQSGDFAVKSLIKKGLTMTSAHESIANSRASKAEQF